MERGQEYVIPLSNPKNIKIYYRTKNRRIKKKQIKKAPIIAVSEAIKKYIGNIKKEDIKINIDGKEIKKGE